ncbi:MAG: DUF4352 domain-containing protein [Armatimonas sp.]
MKSVSIFALTLALGVVAVAAPPKKPTKPPVKPAAKPTPKPPSSPGVKGAGQVAGGVLKFGDLFALKSGFTYQILSARYSLEPFECYETLAPSTGEKLLILTVATKNNKRGEDNFFGDHLYQAVDDKNQNYENSSYLLRSQPGVGFSPTLKPGQGIGQGGTDPLEVAFKMPSDTRLVKLILKLGREGTSEEVTRFFLAGATEAEAGGKPDPKNLITPLPAWAQKGAIVPADQYVPSWTYQFKLNGFSKADKKGDEDAEEGKQWVYANVMVKNPFHNKQNLFDFSGGDDIRQMVLIDGDGEKYPASYLLKAKQDETYEGELEPGEEKAYRVAFLVPKDATFKSVRLGAPRSNLFAFDASTAGK